MTSYFHGGVPGLRVGQRILPPDRTGAPSTARFGAAGVCRTNAVYVTTSKHDAALFAALHPSKAGCLYRVRPVGDLAPDPDCTVPGVSFSCAEAVVIERIRLPGKWATKARKAALRGGGGMTDRAAVIAHVRSRIAAEGSLAGIEGVRMAAEVQGVLADVQGDLMRREAELKRDTWRSVGDVARGMVRGTR